eukprot:COSAG01_NODE_6233_length_3777_cov_2.172648_3_plen_234_part_00
MASSAAILARRCQADMAAPPPPPPPPLLPPLPPLTAQEIATFIREGFLIKRAVLDAELCHQALDHMWDLNTSRQLQRGAPASWVAPIRPDDESADPMNLRRGDHWRLRGLCSTKLVLDMFPRRIWPWLQQLAGEDLVAPREGSRRGWNNWGGYETRGIYNVLSSAAAPGPPDDVSTTEGGGAEAEAGDGRDGAELSCNSDSSRASKSRKLLWWCLHSAGVWRGWPAAEAACGC